ncbi:MAG TPA: hypothetical protein VJ836_05975 [Candidatus Saccharimonadales bacterium]|nr:hypothetical protein [Candidatus Saccharimonadales bacterium]
MGSSDKLSSKPVREGGHHRELDPTEQRRWYDDVQPAVAEVAHVNHLYLDEFVPVLPAAVNEGPVGASRPNIAFPGGMRTIVELQAQQIIDPQEIV